VGRVTLQTVADRVGVSRMTVSNAFSRPDQLSEALRERILAAAADLGYVGPDPAARALARGSVGAVGILLTKSLTYAFTDAVATEFLGAIATELEPTGVALTLLTTPADGDVVPARDVAMDGALVYSCEVDSPALAWLIRRGLPLVFVDQTSRPGIPSINIDDRAGARAAAQHIVDLGHTRVGLVTVGLAYDDGIVTDPDLAGAPHVTAERLRGWTDALDAAGASRVIVNQSLTLEGDAFASGLLLLDRPDRPTAVLCFSDVMADGVIRAATELGLRVPDDLSVVGFDDHPLARRITPALTTVRQPVAEKGKLAAAALTTSITKSRAGESMRSRHIVLPTELVVRNSTAPPPPTA
jgi:DNA-binding LacI/PurR family transcriptional regulator